MDKSDEWWVPYILLWRFLWVQVWRTKAHLAHPPDRCFPSNEFGMRNAECVASIFSHISILIQLWSQAPFAVQKWRCPLIGRSRTATGWRGREEGGVSQLNDDPNWSNVSVVSRHSDWSMLISKSGLRDLLRVRTLNQAIGLVKSSMSKCWRLKVQIWSFGFEKFDICFTCFTSLQKPLESSQVS